MGNFIRFLGISHSGKFRKRLNCIIQNKYFTIVTDRAEIWAEVMRDRGTLQKVKLKFVEVLGEKRRQ